MTLLTNNFQLNRIWLSPVAVATTVLAVALIFFKFWITPYFETNDDVGFMLQLSGKVLSSAPEAETFFLNFALSNLFTLLYSSYPDTQWYGYFHITILFTCIWVIGFVICSKRTGIFTTLFIILFLGNLFFENIAMLQFTRTAYIAGQCGILLAFHLFCCEKENNPRTNLLSIVSLILLLTSFLLRMDAFLLALALNGPLLFFTAPIKEKRRQIIAYGITLFMLLAISGGIHHYHYSKNGWQEFAELNSLKSALNEDQWALTDVTHDDLQEVGWSLNDYNFLYYWGYVNSEIFSKDKLSTFANRVKNNSAQTFPLGSKLETFLNKEIKDSKLLWFAIAMLTTWALSGRNNWKPTLAFTLYSIFTLLAILLWLKLPARVYYPVFTGAILTTIMASKNTPVFKQKSSQLLLTSSLGTILIVCFLIFNAPAKLIETSQKASSFNQSFRTSLKRLPLSESQTIINWGDSFPSNLILPLENKDYLDSLEMISIGALNQSPVQNKRITERSSSPTFRPDPFRTLVDNDDYFLSIRPGQFQLVSKLLPIYIYEHYNLKINLTPAFVTRFFALYKVTTGQPVE